MTLCACVGSQILCSRLPGGVLVLVVHVELEVVQRGLERRATTDMKEKAESAGEPPNKKH